MIKVIVLVPKRGDISSEEFPEVRRRGSSPARQALAAGLRRLRVNYAQPHPDGTAAPYDSVGEDWFDSPEVMQAAFNGPEGRAVLADTRNFADVDRMQVLVVEEIEASLP